MKLSDKIIRLRKSNGWSQEELAEKLDVSRQAVSRWEGASAQPDAANVLQMSRLFGVTTDYLLNEDYESDGDLPPVQRAKSDGARLAMVFAVTLEVMTVLLQGIAVFILQNEFWGMICVVPFAAVLGGFECVHQKGAGTANEAARALRRKFYCISAWLGLYFPARFAVEKLAHFYPRPYYALALEGVILAAYLLAAALLTLLVKKKL